MTIDEINNSNNISLENIKILIENSNLSEKIDFILITSHFMLRNKPERCKEIIETIYSYGLKIILDVVPHSIHNHINLKKFNYVFGNKIYMLCSELFTICNIANIKINNHNIKDDKLIIISKKLKAKFFIFNYGIDNNNSNCIIFNNHKCNRIIYHDKNTGFASLQLTDRIGFGDRTLSKSLLYLLKKKYI